MQEGSTAVFSRCGDPCHLRCQRIHLLVETGDAAVAGLAVPRLAGPAMSLRIPSICLGTQAMLPWTTVRFATGSVRFGGDAKRSVRALFPPLAGAVCDPMQHAGVVELFQMVTPPLIRTQTIQVINEKEAGPCYERCLRFDINAILTQFECFYRQEERFCV
jgi:hypothetical protein